MERTTLKRKLDSDLLKTVQKRNFRLAKFWQKLGMPVDIIGDMEMPAIIRDKYCLACYVHNFYLIFTDHYEQGKELYRIKLQNDVEYDHEQIIEWLKTATHRRIYRIRIKQSPFLFVSGYSMKYSENGEKNKYPVFGKHDPKIYFTEQYAEDIISIYQLDYCEVE